MEIAGDHSTGLRNYVKVDTSWMKLPTIKNMMPQETKILRIVGSFASRAAIHPKQADVADKVKMTKIATAEMLIVPKR